jgi:hypothetical protein
MTKFGTVLFLSFIAVSSAQAYDREALKSPVVKASVKCLNDLAETSRAAGYTTDRAGVESAVYNPSREKIRPLQASAARCMDAAFAKHETLKTPKAGTQRVWYTAAGGGFVWCATNSLGDELKHVERVGGNGEMKNWYAAYFHCGINDRVMDFYSPTN